MYKRKIITVIASIILLLSFSVTVFGLAINEAIKESHNISLSSDLIKISSSSSGTYNNSIPITNGATIYVDNYENGYDLIAVSSDRSDGFVIALNQNTQNYTISSSEFKNGKSYYGIAVMHHPYNRFISSSFELELLNNEFRHSVVNDDLSIGNITDLYDVNNDYIGDNKSYDLNNKVYDFYGNRVERLIDIKTISNDGPTSYEINDISSQMIVNMSNLRRSDIYNLDKSRKTGTVVLATKNTVNDNLFYDAYGRKLNQLYCVIPVLDSSNNVVSYKKSNYIFTKDASNNNILIIDGLKLDQSQMEDTDTIEIDLANCYYENGIIVDNAYNSKVFKNIYLLNNITIDNELNLMMPCNLNLINNNIILNSNLNIKHYYHGNYIISNMAVNNLSGNILDSNGDIITSSSDNKLSFICPNATYTKPDEIYLNNITGKDNLLNDALEFAKGFFYNESLEDEFVLAENFNENKIYFTRSGTGTNDDPYLYNKKNNVTQDNFNEDIYYERNKYSMFYVNPLLPKTFYDENITISYKYVDTNNDFVVSRNENNQSKEVIITVSDGTNNITSTEKIWIVGTSKEAILDSITKEIEYALMIGFKTTSTSRMYINYDTLDALLGNNNISFSSEIGVDVSNVYLPVLTPIENNNSYNLYARTGEGSELSPYTYNKISSSDALDSNTTYYEKYLLFERASYTFSDNAYAIINTTLTDNSNEYNNIIYVALSSITEALYIDYLKQEIGQIYFENDAPFKLKTPEDLAKFDVKEIKYTAKIKNGLTYDDADVLTILDYEITNMGMSSTQDYYVLVEVTLNDGSTTEFYTDKLLASSTSGGGDGENDYQSSLFDKEFSDMSIFIGLSNDFELEGIFYYLEIVNPNSNIYDSYLGLYHKIFPTSVANAKSIVSETGTYYYLNDDLTLTEITSVNQVVDTSPIYTAPKETDNLENYHMVFLTNSDNIPKTSTTINVKAYISDNVNMYNGALLKEKAGDGTINLYEGLYDYNKNPINELTNGKEKYLIYYDNEKNVTSVKHITSLGNEEDISNGQKVDISGYYCNGYIYNQINTGQKIYIGNGIYSNKDISLGTKETSYNHGILTFELTYNEYGTDAYLNDGYVSITTTADFSSNELFYDKNKEKINSSSYNLNNGLYDIEGNPIKNVMLSDSSFSFVYDDENNCSGVTVNYTVADNTLSGKFQRTLNQQTTFYGILGGEAGDLKTIYVQNYTFTVPGVYRSYDFNTRINDATMTVSGESVDRNYAINVDKDGQFLPTGEELISYNSSKTDGYPEVYDLYKALMDTYGQYNGVNEARGYKEINGDKYFLLVSDLDNAEVLAKYDDSGNFILDSEGNYINLDCNMQSIDLTRIMKLLPNIKYIYVSNAAFARHTHIYSVKDDNNNYVDDKIIELSLEHIIGENDTKSGFGSEPSFDRYTNLEKLIIKNSNVELIYDIYRRLKYLDLSNDDTNLTPNKLTDISFILTGVNLEYINLSNNNISSFEHLRKFRKLNSLYITGNNINTKAILNDTTIYPYGTPRISNNILYGQINIPTLIDVLEKNPNLVNTDFKEFLYNELYDGENDYLYAAYTINAISYLTLYNNGLELDLSLIDKASYVSNVYVSKDTTTDKNYSLLTSNESTQYSYPSGYFKTTDTEFIYAIISVTKGSYTIYREIYYKTS